MKHTFVVTSKPAYRPCYDCGEVIPEGTPWWFNYRPSAVVKVLCGTCGERRNFARLWGKDITAQSGA